MTQDDRIQALEAENVLSSPMAAGLLLMLKAECEKQHDRAEAAESQLTALRTEYARVDELLAEAGCRHDTDALKHLFEDHRRWSRDVVEMDVELTALRRELDVTDALLEDRQVVLDAIPPCDEHGPCIPHALEWIGHAKESAAQLTALVQGIEALRDEWRVKAGYVNQASCWALQACSNNLDALLIDLRSRGGTR